MPGPAATSPIVAKSGHEPRPWCTRNHSGNRVFWARNRQSPARHASPDPARFPASSRPRNAILVASPVRRRRVPLPDRDEATRSCFGHGPRRMRTSSPHPSPRERMPRRADAPARPGRPPAARAPRAGAPSRAQGTGDELGLASPLRITVARRPRRLPESDGASTASVRPRRAQLDFPVVRAERERLRPDHLRLARRRPTSARQAAGGTPQGPAVATGRGSGAVAGPLPARSRPPRPAHAASHPARRLRPAPRRPARASRHDLGAAPTGSERGRARGDLRRARIEAACSCRDWPKASRRPSRGRRRG